MKHSILRCAFSFAFVALLLSTAARATDPIFIQQALLEGSNNAVGDNFGHRVAIDGDTAVVGAPNNDTHAPNAGLAYVFVRDASGNWSQQAVLSAAFPREGDNFGQSVAISGDTIVVGAHLDDNLYQGVNPGFFFGASTHDSGAVYVFTRSGSTWSQQAYLKASNAATKHQFGFSVAIDGNTVIVGADEESGSGAAYIFTRSGSTWSEQARLKLSDALTDDRFGYSVGVHGDFAIVGAMTRGSFNTSFFPGAAYIYERSGSTWSLQGSIAAPANTIRRIGSSVAISGNLAVVGAMTESSGSTGVNGAETDSGKASSGAVYILQRNGNTWSRMAFLKASNSRTNARFGISVSIDGQTVLVGSDQETSAATGVNGDETNVSLLVAGAAYKFQLNDGQWTQTAYIKPSNTRSGMRFGSSVALSKGSMIVGAPFSRFSESEAGAAYVLKFQDSGPDLALETATGERLFSGDGVVNFTVARVPLVVRNLGLSPLGNPAGTGGVELAISGADAAFFTLSTPALPGLIDPAGTDTFFITFDPAGPAGTPRNASLTLASNDSTPAVFSISLSGTALSETADSDGDGIPDATEFRLSALGFDWQVSQPELAALLFSNAAGAGLFTESQVRSLNLPTPLIKRDPATNRFTLEIGLHRSNDLDEWSSFPFAIDETAITPEGRIEFSFPAAEGAEFFRLSAQ